MYVRHAASLSEHLLSVSSLLDFETDVHAKELATALAPLAIGQPPT